MIKAKLREILSTQRVKGATELTKLLAGKIALHTPAQGLHATAIDALVLYRKDDPSPCYPASYEPSVHIFTQGQKRVTLGGATYLCKPSTFLLSSVDVPVVSQVVEASSAKPLLSFVLKLDLATVREILAKGEFHNSTSAPMDRALALGVATEDLLRPCLRLIDLLDAPQDIPFLSNLIEREIIYRLLRGPKGERLRAIAPFGAQSHKTAKAIAWLRANYRKPLSLEELAEAANMGTSTLHHHFRALTAMSPLQYQKQLRLVAARERMLAGGIDAASAAFEVGYESASQFNREYKRFFGQPPMANVRANRTASAE
jgi:AraC-like DNA-binding protein